ncbi:hypothetical protein, partial [Roseibium algae]
SACLNTAMICASLYRPFFIKNLLRYLAEKILLLNTTNFRGDYRVTRFLYETSAEIVRDHHGLLASKLGMEVSTNLGSFQSRLEQIIEPLDLIFRDSFKLPMKRFLVEIGVR